MSRSIAFLILGAIIGYVLFALGGLAGLNDYMSGRWSDYWAPVPPVVEPAPVVVTSVPPSEGVTPAPTYPYPAPSATQPLVNDDEDEAPPAGADDEDEGPPVPNDEIESPPPTGPVAPPPSAGAVPAPPAVVEARPLALRITVGRPRLAVVRCIHAYKIINDTQRAIIFSQRRRHRDHHRDRDGWRGDDRDDWRGDGTREEWRGTANDGDDLAAEDEPGEWVAEPAPVDWRPEEERERHRGKDRWRRKIVVPPGERRMLCADERRGRFGWYRAFDYSSPYSDADLPPEEYEFVAEAVNIRVRD